MLGVANTYFLTEDEKWKLYGHNYLHHGAYCDRLINGLNIISPFGGNSSPGVEILR